MTTIAQSSSIKSRLAFFAAAAGLWIGGFLIFVLLTPILSDSFGKTAGRVASSAVCLAAAFASIFILTKMRLNRAGALVLIGASLIVNFTAYALFPAVPARMLVGLSVIAIGYGVGVIVAALVESPKYVVPLCVVATIADIWSVYSGPTKKLLESETVVAFKQHAFVSFPTAGEVAQIQPVAGIADLVFVALFMCIAARLAIDLHKATIGMFIGLIVGLIVAGIAGGIPGIPFLAVGFIAASWKEVRPGKKEIATTAAFLLVMLFVFAVLRLVR